MYVFLQVPVEVLRSTVPGVTHTCTILFGGSANLSCVGGVRPFLDFGCFASSDVSLLRPALPCRSTWLDGVVSCELMRFEETKTKNEKL
jgi:hypothetical protein